MDDVARMKQLARAWQRNVEDDTRRLDRAVDRAVAGLLDHQRSDGHWCFELEADCTIPSEYILMMHFMDEIDATLQHKLAVYIRSWQNSDGGWPLYYQGETDLSCTVKAYYALKLAGDDPAASHMRRAREAVLARGGAARANVFTRIALAQFQQIPWRGVPFMPVEVVLLPRWFPFHLSKVSYWSRTVMVPLMLLCSLRAQAANPRKVQVRELFVVPPEQERHYFPARSLLNKVFVVLDRAGRLLEPLIPGFVRRHAIHRAETWFVERLNGVNGLGAIFPAMVNAYESLAVLGYAPDHPLRRQAWEALRRLLVIGEDRAYCQPCVSPIWDTALVCLALNETREPGVREPVRRALDWLCERQVCQLRGDWADQAPDLPCGGWAFQYANPHYPDLDDTAAVAWALDEFQGGEHHLTAIRHAIDWLRGLQSKNGGFAAFDADNTHYYLNEIPFADHGALLDPPTADVSARVLALMGRLGREQDHPAIERCLAFLRRAQEPEGCWFGRWGTNYIYGTWSVLTALEQAGVSAEEEWVRQAVTWFKSCQRSDGGWGETNDSYQNPQLAGQAQVSTAHQTAWALLGLLAAGEVHSQEVQRGIGWLLEHQGEDGLWDEPWFTAPGFPRVFYLKYHGYARFFPLWALAKYRNACAASGAGVPDAT
ncbi:squalene-hopene cyclase [Litchfieldella qijiaojingensis]|uniref:Squalene-hopene cyclase n=1 Tax=Litchfieldella qijiaojingensis TaxID=980347 RepID=A0ABQ2Z2V2_9GAMM|nr:squalene--hopene cyclase [Halomonas qijiaojingensis]GGY01691.1 squalene-hopene cyclase [Halomonas qijiaojingensis]